MDYRLKEIIKEEYINIENTNSYTSKLNFINTIIEIKISDEHEKNNIYSDLRKYFEYFIKSYEEKNHSYYVLKYERVEKILSYVNLKDQYSLLKYIVRLMKMNGFEEKEITIYYQWLKKLEIKLLFKSRTFKNIVKAIFLCSALNYFTILFSLTLPFLLLYFILLPAFSESYILFEISYVKYCENIYFNHLFNTLTYIFGIDSNFKVVPASWLGVFLALLGKCIFIVVIINILIKELIKRMNIE